MATSISKKRAIEFVVNQLEIASVEEVEMTLVSGTQSERLTLLNKIVRSSNREISFQNVCLLAKKEKCVPRAGEIIDSGLAMYGGLCYDINPFFNFLFNALGYTSHLIAGSYTASKMSNCHVGVVVKGLDPEVALEESSHLVDMGCGFPFFEAIPLHRLPQVYLQAGLEYQLQMVDGCYARLHRKGDTVPDGEASVMVGEWRQVFHFETTPRTLEFIRPFMKQVYEQENPFHESILSVRFPETEFSLLAIKRNEMLIMKDDMKVPERAPIDNMIEVFEKYFPRIPIELVERAIACLALKDKHLST